MKENLPEYWHQYWELFAKSFAHPLTSNGLLGQLIKNPSVTGAYAEAWIMSIAKNMLPQYRISTGAVIRASDQTGDLRKIPQCDIIIWDSSELPAIFEKGDFALVPTQSVHAIIEIKRSCSDVNKLIEQLEKRRKLLRVNCRNNLLGIVIEHPKGLFDGVVQPDWLKDPKWLKNFALISFLNRNIPNSNEIMAFVYFLSQVAGHSEMAA